MSSSGFADAKEIAGVIVRRPAPYSDARGWLMEFFRNDEIAPDLHPAMGYISVTKPGIRRGPHEHLDQHDYFCFPGPGEFLVALWKSEPEDRGLGARMVISAGETNPCIVVVPPTVVHAYACVSDVPGMVINVPNRLYRGEGKASPVDEVRHEDDPKSPFVKDFAKILEARRR